jgi:hypothetical protein
MRVRVRAALPWLVIGLLAAGVTAHERWFGHSAPSSSGPAHDVPLPEGGVSDGDECGTRGYHYFALTDVTDAGGTLPGPSAGPEVVLASYGARTSGADGPSEITIDLAVDSGSASRALELSAPFGKAGVAVEVEGPDGLVGGAHNLPVDLEDATERSPEGKIHVGGPDGGLSVEVKLPAAALCPGQDVMGVDAGLNPPTDSHDTITGQPKYTLTVSFSDPAIAALRAALGSSVSGPVLAADNRVPEG